MNPESGAMSQILRMIVLGLCAGLMAVTANAKAKLGQSAAPLSAHNLKVKDISVEECHGLGGKISTVGTVCSVDCVLTDENGGVHRVCVLK